MLTKLKTVLINQLTMGATPEKLSDSVLFGVIIGVFPVLGATTLLALLAAFIFKLNHVVIQTTNYLVYPIQLLMIPAYIKIVSMVFDVGNIPLRPDLILDLFSATPMLAIRMYALVGLYALVLWAVCSPLFYFSFRPVLIPIVRKFKKVRGH